MKAGEGPSITERETLRQSTCGAAAACALKFPVAPFILARMLTAWNKRSLVGQNQSSSAEQSDKATHASLMEPNFGCDGYLQGRGCALKPVSKHRHFLAKSGGGGGLPVGTYSIVKQDNNAVVMQGPR
jgi:hypothetical protein